MKDIVFLDLLPGTLRLDIGVLGVFLPLPIVTLDLYFEAGVFPLGEGMVFLLVGVYLPAEGDIKLD